MFQEKTTTLNPFTLPGPDTTTKNEALQTTDSRYHQMLRESARVGWPEAFTDDLYQHDRAILARHPGEAMLWILREHGTHLFPLEADSSGEATHARDVIRYWSGEHRLNVAEKEADRARYYLVRDSELIKIPWREAASVIQGPES